MPYGSLQFFISLTLARQSRSCDQLPEQNTKENKATTEISDFLLEVVMPEVDTEKTSYLIKKDVDSQGKFHFQDIK